MFRVLCIHRRVLAIPSNKGTQYVSGVSSGFHVYALEWSEEKMVFSVDSVVHYTYEPSTQTASTWPFDAPQYLLLNIAIQGKYRFEFYIQPHDCGLCARVPKHFNRS